MPVDYPALRLKHHGDRAKLDEILQMECRDKCARKLPSLVLREGFVFPSIAVAEMSTSEAVAEVHASLVADGESVLDMTCGLGIDTFAMARMGASVTSVELDRHTFETACHNAEVLGLGNLEIVNADSVQWISKCGRRFDAIFVDPARRDSSGRHFALSECMPDITVCRDMLLSRCDRLIVKMSPMADISRSMAELGVERCRIIVIGTVKECKEVVFVISRTPSGDDELVECVTVGHGRLTFKRGGTVPSVVYAVPEKGEYLLEPYPAVMKAASLGALGHIEGVAKVAPNTHLFVSPTDQRGFPGERMLIEEVLPFGKTAIKSFASRYGIINVAVRNFPLPAPALAAKLRVKEGGDRMVHGITTVSGDRLLVVTSMPVPC